MVIKLRVFHGRCLHVRQHCHRCHRKFGAASPWSKNEAQNLGVLWVKKDWVGGNVGLTWRKIEIWWMDINDDIWFIYFEIWFMKGGWIWWMLDELVVFNGLIREEKWQQSVVNWGLPWLEIFHYGSGSFWIYSEFWLSSLQSSIWNGLIFVLLIQTNSWRSSFLADTNDWDSTKIQPCRTQKRSRLWTRIAGIRKTWKKKTIRKVPVKGCADSKIVQLVQHVSQCRLLGGYTGLKINIPVTRLHQIYPQVN